MRSKRQVRRRRICGISDRVDLLPNQIAPGKRSAPTIHFANSVGGNEGAFVLVSRCKKKKKEIGLPFFEPLTLQDMLRKEERKEVEEEEKKGKRRVPKQLSVILFLSGCNSPIVVAILN